MAFQIIAVVILIVFYGCYFLKMLSQKKKGIKTDQIGKGKVGFVKLIEVTMKISVCLVPVVEIVSIIRDISSGSVAIRIVGVVVSTVGTAIFISAVLTMRDSWRAGVAKDDQTELVTNGIYRFSRNPAFLGFDLLYFADILQLGFVRSVCVCYPHVPFADCQCGGGFFA